MTHRAGEPARPERVLVIGGGFAGLAVVRGLRGSGFQITLLDRRNFHLFQPLLYQVATGGLSPANIASPLRRIFRRRRDVRVLLGEAERFELTDRAVVLKDGGRVGYDLLVVATGSRPHYFRHAEWAPLAPGLKCIEDAVDIRRRVFLAFEQAERATDPLDVQAFLTFVVVGGGPTGVELAGALAEVARRTMRRDFRSIDPLQTRVLLVEGSPRVLPSYPADLSERAASSLARLGVCVRTDTFVTELDARSVRLERDSKAEVVASRTVVWAAGIRASRLGAALAAAAGEATDELGRLRVQGNLQMTGRDDVYVIGDLARCEDATGRPLPAVAPVAIQQGRHVAGALRARRLGSPPPAPFRYRHAGDMATIGRKAAVAVVGRVHVSGRVAWFAWVVAHLVWLMQFENRVLVLIQWAWSYVTNDRSSRLITGDSTRDPD